jgi:hypothetical protein
MRPSVFVSSFSHKSPRQSPKRDSARFISSKEQAEGVAAACSSQLYVMMGTVLAWDEVPRITIMRPDSNVAQPPSAVKNTDIIR